MHQSQRPYLYILAYFFRYFAQRSGQYRLTRFQAAADCFYSLR